MKNFNFLTSRNFGFVIAFFAALAFVVISSCETGPPKNTRAAQAIKGKVHFQKYCVQCHGEDGKGLIIDSLSTKPANLTRITSSRRKVEFPVLQIANIIDGRKMAKSHGTRQMPIWGEVFSDQEYLDESQIKGKLAEIIAYLMSIQV